MKSMFGLSHCAFSNASASLPAQNPPRRSYSPGSSMNDNFSLLPAPFWRSLPVMDNFDGGIGNLDVFSHSIERFSSPTPLPAMQPGLQHASSRGPTLHSLQDLLMYAKPSQYQAMPSQARSSLSVLTVGGPQSHWLPEHVEVLVKAVYNFNPSKLRRNNDKKKAWANIHKEVNQVFANRGQDACTVHALKEKWKHVAADRRKRDRAGACGSGHVEHRSELDQMIDDILQADAAASIGKSKASAEAHRRHLSNLDNMLNGTPASRSRTTMTERARRQQSVATPSSSQASAMSQSSSASSMSIDDEQESSVEIPSPSSTCKLTKNASLDAVQRMMDNNEKAQLKERKFRKDTLKMQKETVNIGKGLVSTITDGLDKRFAIINARFDRLASLILQSQVNTEAGLSGTTSRTSGTSVALPIPPTIAKEPTTPRHQRAVSVTSSNNATPTRHPVRQSSRAPSQTCTGPYNSY